jgi:hypothetical protein
VWVYESLGVPSPHVVASCGPSCKPEWWSPDAVGMARADTSASSPPASNICTRRAVRTRPWWPFAPLPPWLPELTPLKPTPVASARLHVTDRPT